jgi:transcriptional regulator GlxA family with amidase domain
MKPRRVVMVAMPCAEVVEIGGALDVFFAANRILARNGAADRGYAVEVVSPVRTVRAWEGLRLVADRTYRTVSGSLDTLIVTGIDGPDDARRDRALVRWLARMAPRVRRVVGLCTGAYVLAEAGLLDGLRATTHWMDCEELARRYPAVRVERDPIYVRDGRVYTSAGSTAGLDLLLALVEEDLGRRVALQVAQRMVFYLKRPGGQTQFSALLATRLAEREPLRDLQAWILDHPGADLSVEALACVGFARDHALEVSVRGGGHSVAGKAVCEGGLVIDLSAMKAVRVDPLRRRARAEPGLTLGELDRDCQAFGLATPTGIVSMTGIAGLTLGGGIGWLNGKHGLACDNLRSADVVTADGRLLVASPDEHPDLFWALRGGGANLGVVTSFDYELHEVGPVLGGGVVWPLEAAPRVLRFYADFVQGCPDELSANAVFTTAGDGARVVSVGVAWAGPLDAGEKLLGPLRSFGCPLADTVGPMRYVDLQCGGDAAFPPGRRYYWKAGFVRRLDAAAIDVTSSGTAASSRSGSIRPTMSPTSAGRASSSRRSRPISSARST